MKPGIRRFFAYARARHSIYLKRQAGLPRESWTDDAILRQYRFTNVFRELDRTTAWFRTHVREPLRDRPEVLLAAVIFRMLNRVETGEAIFCQTDLDGGTAFERYLRRHDDRILRAAIIALLPNGPWVTGAYILTSPPGQPKLDGMLSVIGGWARESGWRERAREMLHEATLESTWAWIKEFPWFGPFHAYEIVTDLRHTALLESASDIMTWANPGPGALRGANRVHGRPKTQRVARQQLIEEMRELLQLSSEKELWPNNGIISKNVGSTARSSNALEWPAWEMRDVEHTLCEFDKYERVRLGEGKPRGVYR